MDLSTGGMLARSEATVVPSSLHSGARAASGLAREGRRALDVDIRSGTLVRATAGVARHRRPEHSGRIESGIVIVFESVALAGSVGFTVGFGSYGALFVLFVLSLSWVTGSYRVGYSLSALDEAPALVGRSLVAAGILFVIATATGAAFVGGELLLIVAVPLVVLSRAMALFSIRRLREHGFLRRSALVLGAGRVGCQLASAMLSDRSYGLDPIGFVDADPLVPAGDRPVPVLGAPNRLVDLIGRLHVDVVVIAFNADSAESELVSVVRAADRMHCSIVFVTRLFELTERKPGTEEIDGIPVIPLRRAPFRSWSWRIKRAVDVAVSAGVLALMAPMLLLIAVTSRLVDGPGVIFRQERVGLDGRSFFLLKFRSLRPANEAESDTMWSIKHDDRLSWFGRFLRRSSLDELPQLVNILFGDMSLVGPRPERPHFVAQFTDLHLRYSDRHRVPSGLTGWAQIHGLRGDTSISERARYDNQYIENWSLWLDFKILLRTVGSLFKGSG